MSSRLTVVVGGSRGLGRHLAVRAGRRGDDVLATARGAQALAELAEEMAAYPGSCSVAAGDFLADAARHGLLRDHLNARSGPVTMIISAATIGPVGALGKVDVDDWADALAANVVGPARIMSEALPALRPEDLVLCFSGGGVGGPNPQPNVSSYTTGKTALLHLIEEVAREQPNGPTVVAVAPGSFPTTFTDAVLEADPALAGQALLADVAKTKAGAFDATKLDTLLDYLETEDVHWLSGRCLSARWEDPSRLAGVTDTDRESPDLFRLRRVDGSGVIVQAW